MPLFYCPYITSFALKCSFAHANIHGALGQFVCRPTMPILNAMVFRLQHVRESPNTLRKSLYCALCEPVPRSLVPTKPETFGCYRCPLARLSEYFTNRTVTTSGEQFNGMPWICYIPLYDFGRKLGDFSTISPVIRLPILITLPTTLTPYLGMRIFILIQRNS